MFHVKQQIYAAILFHVKQTPKTQRPRSIVSRETPFSHSAFFLFLVRACEKSKKSAKYCCKSAVLMI